METAYYAQKYRFKVELFFEETALSQEPATGHATRTTALDTKYRNSADEGSVIKLLYWNKSTVVLILKDIEGIGIGCKACCENKKNPMRIWQRIHMDHHINLLSTIMAGPLMNHHFLVVVKARSKWSDIHTFRKASTSESTIHYCLMIKRK